MDVAKVLYTVDYIVFFFFFFFFRLSVFKILEYS